MDAWIQAKPYTVTDNVELDARKCAKHTLTAILSESPPREWSYELGECLYNFRSSLDHLAFELAEKHTGTPLPPAMAETSEFPVFGSRPPTPQELKKKIGGVAPGARAIIERLQPHHRGNPGYETAPLWVLHRLCNIDKHRDFHLTVVSRQGFGVNLIHGSLTDTFSAPVTLSEHGAVELLRYTLCPGEDGRMEVQFGFALFVSFGEGGPVPGQPVIPVLRQISDWIATQAAAPLLPYT